MISQDQFHRSLETIASRKTGVYGEGTKVSQVCSPTGIVPSVLHGFFLDRFGGAARTDEFTKLIAGDATLGEIYDHVAQTNHLSTS
tara:strand:+ start:1304 stop:1561 length:258 start_codon:yes stop_codon:yes gene_type:complete